MRLIWTRRSISNLLEIGAHVARDDPLAADALLQPLKERATTLTVSPFQGRPRLSPDTRELTVAGTRYILVYRISGEQVRVVAVVHTSRLWPTSF